MKQYTLPSQTEMSGFYVVYKGAALSETPELSGISHLTEHLISRKLNESIPEFNQYAVDFNAFTSDDYICFYIIGLDDYIGFLSQKMLNILNSTIVLQQKDFEAEKKIVIEEIFSSKHRYSYTYRLLKENLRYYGPAGTIESVKNIQFDQVQNFISQQYKMPFMTIHVSRQCAYSYTELGHHHALPPIVSLKELALRSLIIPSNDNEMIMISDPIPNELLPLSQVVNFLLCGNINSIFYRKLRTELQLCYSINLSYFTVGDNHLNLFRIVASQENHGAIRCCIRQLLKDNAFMTEELIDSVVNYFKIVDRMHEATRYADVKHLLCNTIFSKGQIDKVNLKNVLQHYEQYYKSTLFVN
jgi:predicted Zn-dependent peptidase